MARLTFPGAMQVLLQGGWDLGGQQMFYVLDPGEHHTQLNGGLSCKHPIRILAFGQGATLHMIHTNRPESGCINNLFLENVTLRGPGIHVHAHHSLRAERCSFKNRNVADVRDSDGKVHRRHAAIVGREHSAVELSNCIIAKSSHSGLLIEGQLTARHCQIDSNSGDGIACMETCSLVLDSCRIRHNSNTGVMMLNPVSAASFTQCDISSNGMDGISISDLEGSYPDQNVEHVVSGCSLHHNAMNGLELDAGPSTGLTVTDCCLHENNSWGIAAHQHPRLSVTGCHILANKSDARCRQTLPSAPILATRHSPI